MVAAKLVSAWLQDSRTTYVFVKLIDLHVCVQRSSRRWDIFLGLEIDRPLLVLLNAIKCFTIHSKQQLVRYLQETLRFSRLRVFHLLLHVTKRLRLELSQPLNTSGPEEDVNDEGRRSDGIGDEPQIFLTQFLRCDENKTKLFPLFVKSLTENINCAHGVLVGQGSSKQHRAVLNKRGQY